MLAMDVGAPVTRGMLQQRDQAAAVDGVRDRHPRGRQQRRHHVAQFDHLCGRGPTLAASGARRYDDEGDAAAALVGVGLAPQVVVALHVAVVGGEHDPGVVPRLGIVAAQPVQQAPDLGIDERDLAAVAAPGALDLRRGQPATPGVGIRRGQRVVVPRGPGADVGRNTVRVAVEVEVVRRRHIGRVRPGEGEIEEEGLAAVAVAEEVKAAVHGPVGRVQAFLGVPGPRVPGVPVHAMVIGTDAGRRVGGEPAAVVTIGHAARFVEFR